MNEDTRRGQLAKRLWTNCYPERTEWEALGHNTKIEWERMAEEFKRIAVESLSKEVESAKKCEGKEFSYMTFGITQSIQAIINL